MALTDKVKNLPTWVWAAGALGVVLLALLMTKGSGGTTVTTPEIPATDINDILGQLQDAINNLPVVPAPATTPPTSTPAPTRTNYWGSSVPDWLRKFDSVQVEALFRKHKLTYGTTIEVGDIKRLLTKMGGYGPTLSAKDLTKYGITYPSTNTVQSSNNQVA